MTPRTTRHLETEVSLFSLPEELHFTVYSKQELTFNEHLWGTCSTRMNSTPTNPLRFCFTNEETHLGPERLSDLPKVTQLRSGRTEIPTQVI